VEWDDQDEVTVFLARADSYGASGAVERIDTHAAIIFLADDRAYKLKRAVKYPYLDFSTAAKRKAVLETELQLNRRTAPELYDGVVAVRRQADGTLGFGEGEPVDWVLVMRRFPADALLENVAERGELTPTLIRKLADTIAKFHDQAELRPGADGIKRVREVIEGNRRSMAALPAGSLPDATCDRLHRASLSALEELAPLLDRRAREGRVRHGHGDLHLANICLWRGEPTLFDCLEFDADLAIIDVLYDLAFLLMDLWHRGYRDEACLLFNRYCDMTDEAEGLASLPLFLSMRAAIRAHVSASAAQRQSDEHAKARKLADARAYLAASLYFLERSEPRLVVVGGLSGSGKSTLAGALAPRLGRAPGARWLRSDVMRKRMAGIAPEDRLPASAYTAEHGRAVYAALAREARAALAAGQSVIVDAVFAAPEERAAIEAAARDQGAPFTGVWLEAPSGILHQRVGARTGDPSDADVRVVERQQAYVVGELGSWHIIEASGTPAEIAREATRLVDQADGLRV
jgi:uncharacterized protein